MKTKIIAFLGLFMAVFQLSAQDEVIKLYD